MVATQSSLSLPDMPGIGPGWEMLLPHEERVRRCTGGTAAAGEERREAIMRACVHLGTRRVAEAFGVSREVVRALRAEAIRTGKLDHLKEEMGRRALSAADKVLDRIEDEVDELPRSSLALTYGILKDKALLLTGQPTQRIEHTVGASHADLNAWLESLPVVSPVNPGVPAGHKGAGLELAAAAGAVIEVAAEPALSASSDTASPVSMPTSEESLRNEAEGGHRSSQKGGLS